MTLLERTLTSRSVASKVCADSSRQCRGEEKLVQGHRVICTGFQVCPANDVFFTSSGCNIPWSRRGNFQEFDLAADGRGKVLNQAS